MSEIAAVFAPGSLTKQGRKAAFLALAKEHRSLLIRAVSGSSDRAYDLDLLWVGKRCALIRHRSSTGSHHGESQYYPGWIERVVIGSEREHAGLCKATNVFKVGAGPRCTPAVIAKLIADAQAFDAALPGMLAAEAEVAAVDATLRRTILDQATADLAALKAQAEANGWVHIHRDSWDESIQFTNYNGVEVFCGEARFHRGPLQLILTCREGSADARARGRAVWRTQSLQISESALAALDPMQALTASLLALPHGA